MQGEDKPEVVKRKKLVIPTIDRAALINARSNFVPQTKTVVVHRQQAIVLDSPERATKNRGGLSTSSGLSLAGIGMRHFQQQKERLTTPNASQSKPTSSQLPVGERKVSNFLTSSQSQSSTVLTSKPFGIGSSTSFSAGPSSRSNSNATAQSGSVSSSITSGMSLSEKFRARSLQKQNATLAPAKVTPFVSHLQSNASSYNAPEQHSTVSEIVTASSNDTVNSAYANESGGCTADSSMETVNHAETSVASGFLGNGRSLSVKSVVHAPVKSVKFTSTASYTSSNNAINASSTTAADAIMYGLHNIGAAESIATYLDAVVVPTLSKARPSVATGKVKASVADTADTDAGNEAGADDNTDLPKSKGKADKAEKADNYNNYVRKNLKSGGSSKKLNRTTSRTSMAKQRWMNRNNETGNSGGGKYGKYSKYKKGGVYSGGGNDNDDNNTGSASNNNSYNKPRGLQQWGLDALEMSLNLIEQQQQQAIEPDNSDNIIATANRADSDGLNVVDKNNSVENKGSVVLEDSEGEDEGEELDQANTSEVDMVVDRPVQANSVSCSNNDTAQATAKRSGSTTVASSGQQSTSASTTATKSHSTTSALATTYPLLANSLLSSIHTNRTTKLSKQSAKLHKAELKQAQRILDNERVTNMTLCAPKCPGHSMPSKLLVVKKSGANKGKYFYSCTFPSEQRCNFFMWAEDNPELLDKSATGGSKYPALNRLKQLQYQEVSQSGTEAEQTDPATQAAQARLQYTLHHYATKLKTFNSEELKAEVLKIGHRLALAGRRTTKISATGTKEELQERILIQAMQILNGDTSCDDVETLCAPVKQTKSKAKATAKPSTKASSKASAKITRKAAIQSNSESDMGSDESSSGDSSAEEGTRRRTTKTVKTKPAAAAVKSKESAVSPSTRSPRAAILLIEAPVAESRRTSARVQAATITNSANPTNNNTTSKRSIMHGNNDEESLHNSDSEPSIDGSEHSNAESDGDEGSEIENDASVNSGVDNGSDGSDYDRIDSESESILLDAAVEVTIDNNTGPSGVNYDSDSSSHSQISVNSVDSVDTSSVVSHNSAESESEGNSSGESIVSIPIKKRPRTAKAQNATSRDASSSDVITIEDCQAETVQQQPMYDELESMLRANFGFSTFRSGQRWAMQRCLHGQSSLLVMPTGAGKSLCYMLPAMALPGLTVVVSPLVALMQDQLRKLPLGLTGACLSGSLTAQEMMQISEAVLQGHIKVLYVSPERLCTPSFRRLITLLKQQQQFNRAQSRSTKMYNSSDSSLAALDQPVVSLLCVDEAHCLSQWSYNFRPAFLRIRREVQFIQPAAVLALTATATPRIQHDVMRHLGIPSPEGLMALPVRRDNLQVSVHLIEDEEQRRKLIVELVKEPRIVDPATAHSEPDHDHNNTTVDTAVGAKRGRAALSTTTIAKSKNKSVPPLSIVYVWRRFEADSLSEYLKASGVPGVAVYHAGIDAGTRARTQLMFDRGKVRCIVATVAFGMGVDKSDVRQVIHCTMPKSIESYMQEMGRAGRDGQPAACHLLLQQEDAVLQHSLSHSMQLSHIQIASLLLKVFLRNTNTTAKGSASNTMYSYATQPSLLSDVSLLLDPLEASMDINSTVAETIMSVLELPPYNLLIVDGTHFDVIQGRFRMITDNLQTSDILVAALLALNTIKPTEKLFDEANQPKSTNGMNESYGLGYDCSASAANQGFSADDDMYSSITNTNNASTKTSSWERDRKLGGSYGGKIQDFQCSRLAIALHTGLNIDEVSTGLYKLQRAGVLEYKLQDSALYLKVLPYTPYSSVNGGSSGQSSVHNGYSSDKCNTVHHFDAYCAQHPLTHKNTTTSTTTSASQSTTLYYEWIWHLSCCVYTSLQKISSGGSHRISDMWRTGSTIAHYNSGKHKTNENSGKDSAAQVSRKSNNKTETAKLSTVDTLAVHEAAQSLLSYVMNDADGETTNADTDVTMSFDNEVTTPGDELYVQMKDMYISTPPPFKSLLPTSGAKTDTSSHKLCDRLRNDIQVLQRDPNLLTAVNTLLKQALPILAHQASTDHISHSNTNTSTTSSSITVQQAKRGLLALSMCRIMHALPTKLLPATAWRDRSDAWGSHKDVDFDQLLTFVVQELH